MKPFSPKIGVNVDAMLSNRWRKFCPVPNIASSDSSTTGTADAGKCNVGVGLIQLPHCCSMRCASARWRFVRRCIESPIYGYCRKRFRLKFMDDKFVHRVASLHAGSMQSRLPPTSSAVIVCNEPYRREPCLCLRLPSPHPSISKN